MLHWRRYYYCCCCCFSLKKKSPFRNDPDAAHCAHRKAEPFCRCWLRSALAVYGTQRILIRETWSMYYWCRLEARQTLSLFVTSPIRLLATRSYKKKKKKGIDLFLLAGYSVDFPVMMSEEPALFSFTFTSDTLRGIRTNPGEICTAWISIYTECPRRVYTTTPNIKRAPELLLKKRTSRKQKQKQNKNRWKKIKNSY